MGGALFRFHGDADAWIQGEVTMATTGGEVVLMALLLAVVILSRKF